MVYLSFSLSLMLENRKIHGEQKCNKCFKGSVYQIFHLNYSIFHPSSPAFILISHKLIPTPPTTTRFGIHSYSISITTAKHFPRIIHLSNRDFA